MQSVIRCSVFVSALSIAMLEICESNVQNGISASLYHEMTVS